MAGKIPQHFIDDLLDRVDIVDVVNTRVQLKKTGKNYSACCPFHDEKTPSFTVSPEKQFFYCFGCQASGNAIGFVMDYDRLSFPEAVEQLARDMGIEVPREESTPFEDERARRKKKLHDTLDKADQFFRQQLRSHHAASHAVNYLKERGLSGQIASQFGIGYAPPGWDNLLKELGDDADSVRLQVDTGLLIEKPDENKRYDRFRNRIMFPIRDTRGRTIAFGGRVLGDDKPKYLNSPETPVFHKGRELYGLYEANQSPGELRNALVVEGYMDVVALAQYGIDNAVATLGTAITGPHLEKLFRYTSEVVFCFDGDRAGIQAAHRALENCLPMMADGRAAKFLFLPAGEDPDSLIRQIGTERFRDRIAAAEPLSQFLFNTVGDGLNLGTPDGKARLAKLAAPYINQLPTGVFREIMFKELAAQTGLDPSTLADMLQDSDPLSSVVSMAAYKQRKDTDPSDPASPASESDPATSPPAPQPRTRPPVATKPDPHNTKVAFPPARLAIAILLANSQLSDLVAEHLELLKRLKDPDIDALERLINLIQEHPDHHFNQILGIWQAIYGREAGILLAGIAACDLTHHSIAAERDNLRELRDTINLLTMRALATLPAETLAATLAQREQLSEPERKLALQKLADISQSGIPEEIKTKLNQLLANITREPVGE